ncbi:response regulator [bacterium]|nr:response regulator [bacterium]
MEEYKVLVIEDDETAREQLAKVIQKEGFEVVMAEDGRVGLEMFKNEHPEIVITDLKMPGIDGLEVMRKVRRFSTNVPIILITAYGETDTAISALREGALDYLKKPLDLELLILALGRAREKIIEYKKAPPFPNLLLADDEEMTRRRLARVLEKEDWKVFQASDGEEALNVFQQTKIDIVLLDIKMPKKDGIQTLHEMRNITANFEAIILTGYGDESSAIQAMRDGAINFLKKPIDLDQMVVSVEKAIEKLTSDRALKYRIRELELAQEIIAKITTEKEIVVDVRKHIPKQVRDFAQKLLDAMPVGLVVLDKEMKIWYANRHLAGIIEYQGEQIDEEFVQRLGEVGGIRELSYDSLMYTVNKLFESPIGTLESISIGKDAYLTLATMTILGDEKKENVVLILLRGERI